MVTALNAHQASAKENDHQTLILNTFCHTP